MKILEALKDFFKSSEKREFEDQEIVDPLQVTEVNK